MSDDNLTKGPFGDFFNDKSSVSVFNAADIFADNLEQILDEDGKLATLEIPTEMKEAAQKLFHSGNYEVLLNSGLFEVQTLTITLPLGMKQPYYLEQSKETDLDAVMKLEREGRLEESFALMYTGLAENIYLEDGEYYIDLNIDRLVSKLVPDEREVISTRFDSPERVNIETWLNNLTQRDAKRPFDSMIEFAVNLHLLNNPDGYNISVNEEKRTELRHRSVLIAKELFEEGEYQIIRHLGAPFFQLRSQTMKKILFKAIPRHETEEVSIPIFVGATLLLGNSLPLAKWEDAELINYIAENNKRALMDPGEFYRTMKPGRG